MPADGPSDEDWALAARLILEPDEDEEERACAGFRLNAPKRESVWLSHGSETRELRRDKVPGVGGFGWHTTDSIVVFTEGGYFEFALGARGTGQASAADGAIIAPMPGKVIAVDVAEGQTVTAGQRLLVLEAMKMEHALAAPFDGVIEGLTVTAGSQVQVEAVLCRVVPAASD
jgi:3-methylcrotonyl-CoA carboxylase alpha subunit